MSNFAWGAAAFIGALCAPSLAFASVDSGDTAWILTSTALVLFMTLPGLALFYAGLVQSKNILSVIFDELMLKTKIQKIAIINVNNLNF